MTSKKRRLPVFPPVFWLAAFGLTIPVALLGCVAPGIQIAVSEPNSANSPAATGLSEADIFPINPLTIAQLAELHSSSRPRPQPTDFLDSQAAYQYKIGPQDIVRVTVWDHPELNNPGALTGTPASASSFSSTTTSILGTAATDSTSRVVADDGSMFYPYVGTVQVAGKTVAQVQEFLRKALAKNIRDPQVEVVVATYRSKRAYITGEVKSPGVLPITDVPLTVADAVAAAGGALADADLTDVVLTRYKHKLDIDLYSMLYKGDLAQNILIQDGDILNVPEQRFNKVFVLGEVVKPGSVLLPRGQYSLNEALADSGGINQLTAKASQVYVIRSVLGKPEIFHLDARAPDALLLADEFELMSRDIVFVDAAEIVRFNRVISQILPALQALQAGKYLGQ